MSVNKHKPHVFVLPEDDANRQMANGFHLEIGGLCQFQVLVEAGGWGKALSLFESDHVGGMRRFPDRFLLLLIDFDGQPGRLEQARNRIPGDLASRVFILGTLTEPERLKSRLGAYETIGRRLAENCRSGEQGAWSDPLLVHNQPEIDRLRPALTPVLFPGA